MRRRYGLGVVALLLIETAVWPASPAKAAGITLVTIHGHVADRSGNPLSGVAVTDGNQTVYTTGVGDFAMPEDNLNDQSLSFSRTGLEPIPSLIVTATQAATSTVNVGMDYKLDLSTTPQSLNNTASSTLTVQVLAYAPPQSCVTWTSPSQSTQTMTYISTNSSGRSTWRTTVWVGLDPEGTYTHSAVAVDCATLTQVSTRASAVYNLDTTPPRVSILAPVPNGNTAFTSQRVIVGLGDTKSGSSVPGSGVNPSTLQVTVTDPSGQEAPRQPAIQQPGSALAKTAPMSLTAGKRYAVTATVSDYAGNSKTTNSQFEVLTSTTTTNPTSITAAIPATTASSKTAGGPLDTTDRYSWTSLKVNLGSFGIDIDSTLHAGDGSVNVAIPTSQIAVAYTVQGIPGLAPAQVVEPEMTTTASFTTDGTGHVNISVPAQGDLPLSKVTALVPKGADDGSVKLSLSGAASRTWFSVCADPWAAPNCSTDPIAKIGPSVFVDLGESMAGAPWLLTTSGGTTGAESVYLGSGVVPVDGHLQASVASSTLRNVSTTNQLVLTAVKATSPSTSLVASASLGLTSGEIDAGKWTDLGAAAVGTATTYPTPEAAVAAAQCPTCSAAGVKEPSPGHPGGIDRTALEGGPPSGDPRPPASPLPDTGEGPVPGCAEGDVCGIPTSNQRTSATDTYTCGMPTTGADCIVAYRDRSWVRALRGFSQKLSGFRGQFEFKTATTQQWQNGWRMSAGAFGADGITTRTKGGTANDKWEWRNDCGWDVTYSSGATGYFPPTGPNCESSSRLRMEGYDTWRWEKHVRADCYGAPLRPCSYLVYERNYNYGFDSGAEVGWDTINWAISLARPSEVRNGQWGRAARWGRDASSFTYQLDNTVAVGNGASVSVDYPESFGNATFTSDVTNTRLSGVTNTIVFRNELPMAGWWYRYDNRTDWRWEYWSCESAIGWSWSTCWDNGS